jgi:hypothetical protein
MLGLFREETVKVKDLETKLSKRETVEVPDTTPTAGNEQGEGASSQEEPNGV